MDVDNNTHGAPDDSQLLTADQVIDLLLAKPALRQKALTCVLRAVRVGFEWRFDRRDLESWIERES
jgi:hypothetical protein